MAHKIKNWFISQSIRHPKQVIIFSILLTVIVGSGVRWVVIDDDIMKMLPEDIPSRVLWDEVQDEFGSIDMMFITFGKRGEFAINREILAALWDVSYALEDLPEIDEVISIATLNRIDSEDGFMMVSDLQPARDLIEKEIQYIANYLERNPSIKTRVISRTGEFTNVVIRPITGVNNNILANRVISVSDKYLTDFEVHFGGQPYITGLLPELIRDDVKMLMPIGLMIMILILLANLRNISAVGMVLSVIFLSGVSMMGFMGWIVHWTGSSRFFFTMVNTSMPIILLTIANSDGVHILTKFLREMRKRKDVKESVNATMNTLMLPIFLTSLTTAAAFSILTTTPIIPMTGYGISISFGIVWAWFLSTTYLPSLIILKKWKTDSKAVTHASFLERVIHRFGRQILQHPRKVLVAGLVIVLIGVFGIFLVKVEINFITFFKPGNPIRESIEFIDKEMTGTLNLVVRTEGNMKNPQTLNDLLAIQKYMETYPEVTTTISIADVVKQMHRVVMDDDPAYEVIPDSAGKVNNLFTLYTMSGDPEDFNALVDYNYRTGVITAMMRTVSTDRIITFVRGVEEYVRENIKGNLNPETTGLLVIMRDFSILLIQSSLTSMIASIFVIFIIAWIFYKSYKWGLLSVIPLTSAIILNFGLMGLFKVHLNHVTAILSSIIIGVGVDFAIHYIAQFRNFSRNGVSKESISREVVDDVGYPILLDAGSNMAFGALIFSTFLPLQYIGGLMVFAMVSCSLGTLTILASLMELLKENLYGE
ncbi:MAG: MMPL family transporter [Candidatus Marinimicrobia bacterium]|nr:MMPL family transporter [Candidatus Neomarinimicrobiota bacterium]